MRPLKLFGGKSQFRAGISSLQEEVYFLYIDRLVHLHDRAYFAIEPVIKLTQRFRYELTTQTCPRRCALYITAFKVGRVVTHEPLRGTALRS